MNGGTQVPPDELDRAEGQGTGDRLARLAGVTLDRVGEGVHAGGGGGERRKRQGEVRITEGHGWIEQEAADRDLEPARVVDEHRPEADLTPRARRGWNRDDRKRPLPYLPEAHVFDEVAAARRQDGDGLGRVQRAAAPHANDDVAARLPELLGRLGDEPGARVGPNAVVDRDPETGGLQELLGALDHTRPPHARVGHDQRPGAPQRADLLGQLLEHTVAEVDVGRDGEEVEGPVEIEGHGSSTPRVPSLEPSARYLRSPSRSNVLLPARRSRRRTCSRSRRSTAAR